MGSCGRDGEKWTDSFGQMPEITYLFTIGLNNLVRKLRLRQVQGWPQDPQQSWYSPLRPEAKVLSTPLPRMPRHRSFLPSLPSLLPHSSSGHSLFYLVGVICLGLDKHPPTSFPYNTCSTHRCKGNSNKQASPLAFKLRTYTSRPCGPRQSWVVMLPCTSSVTLANHSME